MQMTLFWNSQTKKMYCFHTSIAFVLKACLIDIILIFDIKKHVTGQKITQVKNTEK